MTLKIPAVSVNPGPREVYPSYRYQYNPVEVALIQ